MFDEFQDILDIERSDVILAEMRSTIQFQPDTPYFFSGSVRNDMMRIFDDSRSPFFKSAVTFTVGPIDAEDFERIIVKYKGCTQIKFLHKPLIGIDWQKGLASVDALAIPYGNDRYLYHTSALISNAMGYRKPIIAADNVNPEILAEYDIGISFKNGDMNDLQKKLECFINDYDVKQKVYSMELERAYNDYSPTKLAENIVRLAGA